MSTRRGMRALLAAAAIAAAGGTAEAQQSSLAAAFERVNLSGSLRAGYWSSTRDLDATDPQFGTLAWLKATGEITPYLAGFVEGWGAVRGPHDDTHATGAIREAYVDVRRGRLDARVGRQILAWGRADGINPTDNLTPRDLTMLVPDEHDRRLGSTGVRASWYEGEMSFSAVWLAEFQPHRVPLPVAPGAPAFRERYERWPGETWALRAERTGGTVDWSVSYMRGPDLQPDIAIGTDPAGSPAIVLNHDRIWVAGADAAMNLGRFGVRAEVAYTGTGDDDGSDPFTKNDHLFVVLGADRSFTDRLNVNLQYLSRYIVDFTPMAADTGFAAAVAAQGAVLNSQVAHVQHGATTRIKYSWLHETLSTEVASVAWFGPRGIALVPKASYAITDHWTVVFGGEVYRGDDRSTLGLFRPNSVGYAEVRVVF